MECMNIAMRGRWKNGKWEQTYEVNKSGIANSITTVQKDTLILEKVVDMEEVTNIMPDGTERNGTERNGTERNGTDKSDRFTESDQGVSGQSKSVLSDGDLSINQSNRLQKPTEDIHRIAVICCKLNKMPQGKLTSLDDARLCDFNTPTASTVTSRYYKGIGAHKDNMVMEIWERRLTEI